MIFGTTWTQLPHPPLRYSVANVNVFYHYFANYHYFAHPQTLFFTFSPRRRQRRRQQYEVFQKIFYETSLIIAKIYHFIISIQNKQTFQFIDSQHSIFTF
jgi:hypothetical protein